MGSKIDILKARFVETKFQSLNTSSLGMSLGIKLLLGVVACYNHISLLVHRSLTASNEIFKNLSSIGVVGCALFGFLQLFPELLDLSDLSFCAF